MRKSNNHITYIDTAYISYHIYTKPRQTIRTITQNPVQHCSTYNQNRHVKRKTEAKTASPYYPRRWDTMLARRLNNHHHSFMVHKTCGFSSRNSKSRRRRSGLLILLVGRNSFSYVYTTHPGRILAYRSVSKKL